MCKFTYLGYGSCDEPERHYLIRREKCSAKANLKHWCPPQDQDESPAADEKGKFWVSLPCPICADTPVVYDQPLLEIAHSRRSVLPAPHYDSVTGKYSRFAKHHAHHPNGRSAQQDTPTTGSKGSPESLVPKPLKMARFQVKRAASETSATRINDQELSPDYLLPATTYSPSPQENGAIKSTHFPQPAPLTPPTSRESSRSPPQSRIDASVRAIPPGESSRHELASLRDRAKAAAAISKDSRPATPQSQRGLSDRSRSGSESSTASSAAPPVLPSLSKPSRKVSNASSNASSAMSTSSPPSRSGSERSRPIQHSPPRMRRKEGPAQFHPEQHLQRQDSVADNLAAAAMRPFERGRRPTRRDTGGSGSERSNSPVVWRPTISQPTLQQDSLGIGEGSDIIVEPFKQRLVPFRPSKNGRSIARGQGLVEDPPRPKTRAAGSNNHASPPVTTTTTTKTSALSLFPNQELDDKVANEAFVKMFETEQRAHAYQAQAQAQAMAQARAQTDRAMGLVAEAREGSSGDGNSVIRSTAIAAVVAPASSKHNNKEAEDMTGRNADGEGDEYSGTKPSSSSSSSKTAAVARKVDKMLPNVPISTALRRIKTGQVKTVTVAAPSHGSSSGGRPRPMRRANTAETFTTSTTSRSGDSSSSSSSSSSPPQISAPTNFVKVKAGGPLFSFAGVTGGKHGGSHKYAQEFEIVTGPDGSLMAEPALGEAF